MHDDKKSLGTEDMSNLKVLEMENIYKSFNNNYVLENINFSLNKGEVCGIVGQNGAGKSTLMKILTGVYQKDKGNIKIDGKIVEIHNSITAREYGISMIFQEFSLIHSLKVYQNVFLTKEPKINNLFINDNECIERTKKILNSLGVTEKIDPKEYVKNISVGSMQIVEIAKALASNSRILIMDEPTASLSKYDIGLLFKVIKKLRNEGISIIYISHYLKDVLSICNRITVLRDGRIIFTKEKNNLNIDNIVKAMVGEAYRKSVPRKGKYIDKSKKPLLEVKNLSDGKVIKNVNIKVWKGEVVGIVGLLGSGRSEIINTIFGLRKKISGSIYINGKEIIINSPKNAINAGIMLIPEDRRTEGLIINYSVKENIVLSIWDRLKNLFIVNENKAKKITEYYIKKINIKTKGFREPVRYLSGGNQQKVVISKSLSTKSKILLLDDPTFGIDIESKQEIVKIICDYADAGNGVIFISSELDEIASFCDRVLILKSSKVTKEILKNQAEFSEEYLLKIIQ